jgi:pimeloyl-ACP methyl ester carboxylesterase
MSWALLRFPLLVGESMQQEIGFARNPSDGVQLAYAVTGEGPAILAFLGWATHVQEGLGSTLYDPDGLVPLSSHRNRFVRIDGRGFGLSDRDVNDFSLEASVGDLRAVIDALGEEKVGLYTYSSGGPTAIAFAARHPERVSGLVLASTFGSPFMSEEQQEAQQRIRAIIAADWEKPFAANLIVDRLAPEADGVTRRMMAEFLRRSCDGPSIVGFFEETFTHDVRDLARQISVPTLVLHGADDAVVPVEAGRQLAALIPGARFELVEGGHRHGIGATPETRAIILDFFNEGRD